MRPQKMFILILFISLIPLSAVHAQQDSTAHSLQPGSKALLFQISDNFNLSSFSGTFLSYKRQVTESRARRFGLHLNNYYMWTRLPDTDSRSSDDSLDLGLGFDYTWMHYTDPQADIKFYYGYGPSVDFRIIRRDRKRTDRKSNYRDTYYALSGLAYAGVEWFFHPSMSLHAEYRSSISVTHSRRKSTYESTNNSITDKARQTTLSLAGNGVRFGMSVYF